MQGESDQYARPRHFRGGPPCRAPPSLRGEAVLPPRPPPPPPPPLSGAGPPCRSPLSLRIEAVLRRAHARVAHHPAYYEPPCFNVGGVMAVLEGHPEPDALLLAGLYHRL